MSIGRVVDDLRRSEIAERLSAAARCLPDQIDRGALSILVQRTAERASLPGEVKSYERSDAGVGIVAAS
ncbi:MAG TPA: hypothetical protein VFX12_05550 [Vicinamibacterales bacterium]|nr:hypothetical protein [Vicinamibacterales bacterium]